MASAYGTVSLGKKRRPITREQRLAATLKQGVSPGTNLISAAQKNPKPTPNLVIRPRHKSSHSFGSMTQKLAKIFQDSRQRMSEHDAEMAIYHRRLSGLGKSATPKTVGGSRHRRFHSAHIVNERKPAQAVTRKEQKAASAGLYFAHGTKKGMIPDNPAKPNQDSFIESQLAPKVWLFGVADGHGMHGHDVSGYIKTRYPRILASVLPIEDDVRIAIFRSVGQIAADLMSQHFDINFSGTTFVSTILDLKQNRIVCANIGDSRALLARQVEPQRWMSIALNRDHKADEPDEMERIVKCGGRVQAYQDEEGNPLGPSRVWLLNENIPGLAMSRSIGDLIASSVGVSCEPEILEQELTPQDKFVVLGSDGIFEFMSNEEVLKIVVPFWNRNDVKGACDQLVREAHKKWLTEEEVIDDITCVVVFIRPKPGTGAAASSASSRASSK